MAALAVLGPLLLYAALGPRYGGELRVGVMELPATTEPGAERGIGAGLVSILVHETLVGVDEAGFPSPALAQGWSTAAGGREWTLRLREGAAFHDGRPVGAADAARSIRRFLRSPSFAAARMAEGLEEGVSTRLLIYAAQLITLGIPPVTAAEVAMCSPITDDRELQRSIREIVTTVI